MSKEKTETKEPGPAKKLLQTAFTSKEVEEIPIKPGAGPFIQVLGLREKPRMDDASYILKYGLKEEIAELKKMRAKVEMRRAAMPPRTYYICQNPACLHVHQAGRDGIQLPSQCIFCNLPGYSEKDSKGWLRPMKKTEISKFLIDEEASFKKACERIDKAGLFARNESRQRQGLEPLTMEQFKAEDRRP
jgi:hypothetical protein